MALKLFQRTVKHRWHTSQAGVSASVRKKKPRRSAPYRKVVQDVRQNFEADFRVTIDLQNIVSSVIGQAIKSSSLKATMLRGLVRAECIQRRDLGLEVIPLPLAEDEELVRDDETGS